MERHSWHMQDRFIIGRDRWADIPVADESVSRRHAEVTFVDGSRLFIVDCQSSNGTFVIRDGNVTRITRETVYAGDQLKLGNAVIPVSELFEALRSRMLALSPPPVQPAPYAPAQMMQCACGAVKAMNTPCPACGSPS